MNGFNRKIGFNGVFVSYLSLLCFVMFSLFKIH